WAMKCNEMRVFGGCFDIGGKVLNILFMWEKKFDWKWVWGYSREVVNEMKDVRNGVEDVKGVWGVFKERNVV
uniref:hypothetical protein n=1 Tax=Bacillus sp. WP8 TaxID=756828 RepID=UPI001C92EBB6